MIEKTKTKKTNTRRRDYSLSYINSSESGQLYCNKLNPFAEFFFRFKAYSKLLFHLIRKKVPLSEILRYRFPYLSNNYEKPTVVSMEFSSICNLKCRYCISSLNILPKGFMEPEVFSKILEDLEKLKISRVHIVGNGEQTLHPDFINFIDKLSRKVKFIDIVSNGQWINNNIADCLINSKVDRIDISIDVGGKENYESERVGANYEKLLSNLIYLKEKKDRLNPSAIINIRLMLKPSKSDFLKNEIKFWKKFSDTIMVAPLCIFSQQDQFVDYGDDIYTLSAQKYEYPKCSFAFNELHFAHNGYAAMCQLLANKKNPEDIYLGNIKTHTMDELWNHPKMKDLRYGQRKGITDKMEFCKGCSTC